MASLNALLIPDVLVEVFLTGGGAVLLSSQFYSEASSVIPDARPADRIEVYSSSVNRSDFTATHKNGSSATLTCNSGLPYVRSSHPWTVLPTTSATLAFRLVWFRRAGDR